MELGILGVVENALKNAGIEVVINNPERHDDEVPELPLPEKSELEATTEDDLAAKVPPTRAGKGVATSLWHRLQQVHWDASYSTDPWIYKGHNICPAVRKLFENERIVTEILAALLENGVCWPMGAA